MKQWIMKLGRGVTYAAHAALLLTALAVIVTPAWRGEPFDAALTYLLVTAIVTRIVFKEGRQGLSLMTKTPQQVYEVARTRRLYSNLEVLALTAGFIAKGVMFFASIPAPV